MLTKKGVKRFFNRQTAIELDASEKEIMCLAIPAKLIRMDDEYMGTVDMDGTQRDVSLLLLQDAQLGDYLIIHAGFAIHRIDETEALASLKILREMAALPEAKKL